MARFTRKEVRAIIGDACTDEMENQIMALHLGVVDPMKDDLEKYKASAEQLESVQKELDGLKNGKDWKSEAETIKKQFEDYKNEIAAKETRAAKESAVKAYFEAKGITGTNLAIAMRGAKDEIGAVELDGDKIKNTDALDSLIGGEYKGLITTTTVKGAPTATPPANTGGGKTKAEILAIKDTGERQKAIAENINLFRN